MSDNIDGNSYKDGRQARTPSGEPEPESGAHPPKQNLRSAPPQASKSLAGVRASSLLAALRRHKLLAAIVILLVVPVLALILGYVTRPAPGTASQAAGLNSTSGDSNAASKIAKPAPGKPLLSTSQAPLPTLSSPSVPQAIPDQSQSGLSGVPQRPLGPAPALPNSGPNTPSLPSAPGVAAKPPVSAMVYSARHEKHFGSSCDGQLTLDGSGLVFRCSDDPGGSFQVALADIQSVDSNGIRLTSGKKYHFAITGMSKDSEEQLFANWLQQAR